MLKREIELSLTLLKGANQIAQLEEVVVGELQRLPPRGLGLRGDAAEEQQVAHLEDGGHHGGGLRTSSAVNHIGALLQLHQRKTLVAAKGERIDGEQALLEGFHYLHLGEVFGPGWEIEMGKGEIEQKVNISKKV